jgi:hypothetical protein
MNCHSSNIKVREQLLEDWRSNSDADSKAFLFAMTFRRYIGPIQPPVRWIPAAHQLIPVLKRTVSEADHRDLYNSQI